jgi:hypothetical protein
MQSTIVTQPLQNCTDASIDSEWTSEVMSAWPTGTDSDTSSDFDAAVATSQPLEDGIYDLQVRFFFSKLFLPLKWYGVWPSLYRSP